MAHDPLVCAEAAAVTVVPVRAAAVRFVCLVEPKKGGSTSMYYPWATKPVTSMLCAMAALVVTVKAVFAVIFFGV